mmetsp:Transcript_9405/g.17101  ORF Transcript_9405/g.17101 Transcript_9405/m.17101 type:complete len:115 (+) Transcript_9405:113-457(+)
MGFSHPPHRLNFHYTPVIVPGERSQCGPWAQELAILSIDRSTFVSHWECVWFKESNIVLESTGPFSGIRVELASTAFYAVLFIEKMLIEHYNTTLHCFLSLPLPDYESLPVAPH